MEHLTKAIIKSAVAIVTLGFAMVLGKQAQDDFNQSMNQKK